MHVSPQVHQQELGAQIRLPPLNPKATAALKHLSAGMGALFAGPVDDATLLLQWNTSSSGSSLPMGGAAYRQEDHDSAAAAALGQGHLPGIGSSSSSKSRVSCVVFGPVPGRLWAGCADGRVHCWDVGGDGAAARLLHSWEAHSGKIKGIALSPCGRLFTGVCRGGVVGACSNDLKSSVYQPCWITDESHRPWRCAQGNRPVHAPIRLHACGFCWRCRVVQRVAQDVELWQPYIHLQRSTPAPAPAQEGRPAVRCCQQPAWQGGWPGRQQWRPCAVVSGQGLCQPLERSQ
jgi:hypothetical protein